jgi:hypothetical protein
VINASFLYDGLLEAPSCNHYVFGSVGRIEWSQKIDGQGPIGLVVETLFRSLPCDVKQVQCSIIQQEEEGPVLHYPTRTSSAPLSKRN